MKWKERANKSWKRKAVESTKEQDEEGDSDVHTKSSQNVQ